MIWFNTMFYIKYNKLTYSFQPLSKDLDHQNEDIVNEVAGHLQVAPKYTQECSASYIACIGEAEKTQKAHFAEYCRKSSVSSEVSSHVHCSH